MTQDQQERKDFVEMLRELTGKGESSLDLIMRVYGYLKDDQRPLYDEFIEIYEQFGNGELDEVEPELLDRVCAAIENGVTETKSEISLMDQLK